MSNKQDAWYTILSLLNNTDCDSTVIESQEFQDLLDQLTESQQAAIQYLIDKSNWTDSEKLEHYEGIFVNEEIEDIFEFLVKWRNEHPGNNLELLDKLDIDSLRELVVELNLW